jgi:hypothetical protein
LIGETQIPFDFAQGRLFGFAQDDTSIKSGSCTGKMQVLRLRGFAASLRMTNFGDGERK